MKFTVADFVVVRYMSDVILIFPPGFDDFFVMWFETALSQFGVFCRTKVGSIDTHYVQLSSMPCSLPIVVFVNLVFGLNFVQNREYIYRLLKKMYASNIMKTACFL